MAPQMRARFTVKGANAAALVAGAQAQANALAGVGYAARVTSIDVQADMRAAPDGEIIGWRAEVEAEMRERRDPDEEPF